MNADLRCYGGDRRSTRAQQLARHGEPEIDQVGYRSLPGCPPRPEQIIEGILKIQELAKNESFRRRNSDEYKKLLNSYGME